GLVIATGDLGSALVFMFMTVGLMFIAGVYLRYFVIAAIGIGIAAPVIWFEFLSNFQKQRFLAVYHPSSLTESVYKNAIYQQQQGLSAIGAGKLTGQGLFNGTYTQGHLVPENQNDMIFSVVGEELGFIGCVLLLVFILLIVLKIIYIGRKAGNLTGRLICYGTAIMIAAQTIINVGMCLEVLPVIGITLPFMSSGGSASLCIYISIGLVLCVYRSSFSHTPTEVRSSSISTPFEEI
ncbi:MAG: FtsW/RodA/SpoVE family cell cycle protein, partial [Clostridia bacterium]|nr:FtsW/RodA/SpoVE family cell cycle protein [Clostridia bacterium]